MKPSAYRINFSRYEEEKHNHTGETHPTILYSPGDKLADSSAKRPARLDRDCDIAEILGITRQTLCNLKNGKNPCSEIHLRRLGEIWDVNWKWLCGLSDYRSVTEEKAADMEERLENGEDLLFSDIAYMHRLGFTTFFLGRTDSLTFRYRHPDTAEREETPLTIEQFHFVRRAMNRAAAAALLSCLDLIQNNEKHLDTKYLKPKEEEQILVRLHNEIDTDLENTP